MQLKYSKIKNHILCFHFQTNKIVKIFFKAGFSFHNPDRPQHDPINNEYHVTEIVGILFHDRDRFQHDSI